MNHFQIARALRMLAAFSVMLWDERVFPALP
jgi:hypothetical protein